MKIRKKPVEVNGWRIAELLDLAKMGAGTLPKQVKTAYAEGLIEFEIDRITVATMEGVMTGWADWWLIQGVQGEWYPCDGDIFALTYDIVDATEVGYPIPHVSIDPYANSPEV